MSQLDCTYGYFPVSNSVSRLTRVRVTQEFQLSWCFRQWNPKCLGHQANHPILSIQHGKVFIFQFSLFLVMHDVWNDTRATNVSTILWLWNLTQP